MQGHFYLTHCRSDSRILVLFVCFVLVLETAHTATIIHIVWSATVTGTILQLSNPGSSSVTSVSVLYIAVITISVQAYYFHRIRQLSGKIWISLVGWGVTIMCFGAGIFLCYKSFTIGAFAWQSTWGWLIKASFASIASIDIFITGLLVFYLKRVSTPLNEAPVMESSVELINRLIIWTVETGMLTSITSIVVLISFQMMNLNYVWFGLFFSLGKLYSNSLLASLNARTSNRKKLGTQMFSESLIFPLSKSQVTINKPYSSSMFSERPTRASTPTSTRSIDSTSTTISITEPSRAQLYTSSRRV